MAIASSYKRTSAPGMPFPLAEARIHLKNEEVTADDALVTALTKAAGEMAENKTGRAFMQSTWLFTSEDFPECNRDGWITLRPGPLVSVTSVSYYAEDAETQTVMVAGTHYEVDTRCVPGRIRFLDNLPSVDDRFDAVEIVFVAGYGVAAATEAVQQAALPPDVVAWMKLQLTTLYEMRQLYLQGMSLANIKTFSDSLIYPYLI